MRNGTQDILIRSIYHDLRVDVDWKMNCIEMIERENFPVVRKRETPHNWRHQNTNVDVELITCREFISRNEKTRIINHSKVNQSKSWGYDESFALKSA